MFAFQLSSSSNPRTPDSKLLKVPAIKSTYLKVSNHYKQPRASRASIFGMPFSDLLLKGVKLTARGAGLVAVVAVVNIVPAAAYERSGWMTQKDLERNIKAQQSRPGT